MLLIRHKSLLVDLDTLLVSSDQLSHFSVVFSIA